MGRWTQHDEDEHRLPEGFVRVAYDADTAQYTFRDTGSGALYRSASGVAYGRLYPVSDHLSSRPNAFAPQGTQGLSRSHTMTQNPFTTFHDILPTHAIATSPTKTSSRFLTPTSTHLRSQSTRVPSTSQNDRNALHSRSRSVPNERIRSRHTHGVQHNSRPNPDATSSTPPLSSNKNMSRSGFSFSSAWQSLSRSFTIARKRRANPTQRRSDNNSKDPYKRM